MFCGFLLVLTGNDGRLKLPKGEIELLLHISDEDDIALEMKGNYFS
jgi:hypothetical protein